MWSLAERYANFMLGLAATLMLARLLTPAQMGVYSVCAAIGAMATILRDFGVSEHLIQERKLTRDKVRAAMGVALITAWTFEGTLYLAREPGGGLLCRAWRVTGACDHHAALPDHAAFITGLRTDESRTGLSADLLPADGLQLGALGHLGTAGMAWLRTAGVSQGARCLCNVANGDLGWLPPRDTFVMPSLREARPVLRFGATYMASRTIETIAQNAHEPVIAKAFGFSTLGLFSRASGMVELFRNNRADAITPVATPAFGAEHRAGRPTAQALLRTTAVFTALSWPFFGFVALAATEIIGLMLGLQWLAAAPLAAVLALAASPAGLHEFVPQLLSSTGNVRRRLQVSVCVSAVHIAGGVNDGAIRPDGRSSGIGGK